MNDERACWKSKESGSRNHGHDVANQHKQADFIVIPSGRGVRPSDVDGGNKFADTKVNDDHRRCGEGANPRVIG